MLTIQKLTGNIFKVLK